MNPWHLSTGDLLIFGLVFHLIADFPLQNDWMALNKAKRASTRYRIRSDLTNVERGSYSEYETTRWFNRHPAAYVHAGIQTFFLTLVFGWPAFFIGLAHLIIDCRWIVEKWSKFIKQTQPTNRVVETYSLVDVRSVTRKLYEWNEPTQPIYDIGTEVRIWTDQVFHIACLLVAAILVA